MGAFILIVIASAGGGNTGHWTPVSMQRFADAKACQFASLQIVKRAVFAVDVICVPEASK